MRSHAHTPVVETSQSFDLLFPPLCRGLKSREGSQESGGILARSPHNNDSVSSSGPFPWDFCLLGFPPPLNGSWSVGRNDVSVEVESQVKGWYGRFGWMGDVRLVD